MRSVRKMLALVATSMLLPAVARADEPADEDIGMHDLETLINTTGRFPAPKPRVDELRFRMTGELQLRGVAVSSYPLDVTASTKETHPGAIADSLGQNYFVTQWIRVNPRFLYKDKLAIVGQFDLFPHYTFGDVSHEVTSDQYPRDNSGNVARYVFGLRWLYGETRTSYGLWRIGLQPNHWGMGILANDGDHKPFFGDYRGGSLPIRLLFATKPAGAEKPYTVAVFGDVVYADQNAVLARGDIAVQGGLAGYYEEGMNRLGVYGVVRSQRSGDKSVVPGATFHDTAQVGVIDFAGQFGTRVAGSPSTIAYGAFEVAGVLGSATFPRTNDQAAQGGHTNLQSLGAAASVGFVFGKKQKEAPKDPHDLRTYGMFVSQVELGYASGDANPYDGTERRFTFESNHRVGLILFDEVMRWQTARAADAARDPKLSNGDRPAPGIDLLPSNGGIFGAQYIYPTAVFRPIPNVDIKLGALFAQSTVDVVDPYRLAVEGQYVNYRGGDSKRRDLGIELDAGIEWRVHLAEELRLELGLQAGIFVPGGAFADATGVLMRSPGLTMARAGLQF